MGKQRMIWEGNQEIEEVADKYQLTFLHIDCTQDKKEDKKLPTNAWIITYLDSYNRLYGSIGTFLALLVWVNANSSVLLLGFEFNASIHKARNRATKILETKNK